MTMEKKGMMFVLSSPSGVGKTTLTKELAKKNSNFAISISHTTRKPRPNEIHGKDYYFVNEEEFIFFCEKRSTYIFWLTKAFAKVKLDKPVPNIQTLILFLILTTKIRWYKVV